MKKRKQEVWLDMVSYLLMPTVIAMFILFFIEDSTDLLGILNIILLLVLAILWFRYRRLKRNKQRYDALFEWLQSENQDLEKLPEDLTKDVARLRQELEKRNSYEALQAHMEFAVLQNQINPHFLYNTLDAIRSQALSVHADEIADMTGRLSRFFRYSIKNQGNLVTVAEEMKNIEDYFSIQHYRFEDRFQLEFICENEAAMGYYLPKMTFQPLVENALYHGLEPKKGNGRVRIRIEMGEQSLYVVISDDGVGMDAEKVTAINRRFQGESAPVSSKGEKRTGIALYNVNKRLQLLFGRMYGLHITSTPGIGTDVEIRTPLVDDELRSKYQQHERG